MNINYSTIDNYVISGIPSIDTFKRHKHYIKWCTPSILPEVKEDYNTSLEGSVSIASSGKLQDNTGVFSRIHKFASIAFKNVDGHSHFCCEGTSGANRVLFDLISKIFMNSSKSKILATRNVHQSVVVNAMKNRIPIKYIRTRFDADNGIFLPPLVGDIIEGIDDDVGVVLLSNPTYEGLSCDLKKIIEKIKQKDDSILIYIDEAWGAHFSFSDKLPFSGTQLGADFVVQSLHKQCGAPNPSSIIHLNKKVVDNYFEDFIDSYTNNLSTTYSYPLIAAMDHTRHIMQYEGENRINNLIFKANYFKEKVSEIPGIKLFETVKVDGYEYDFDRTKINLDVTGTGLSGDYIAKKLEDNYGIITEKEELSSICLIVTFEISIKDVLFTTFALNEIISSPSKNRVFYTKSVKIPENLDRELETYEIENYSKKRVLLEYSKGYVLAENIKCYPPGIYVAQKGEVMSEELIDFLIAQKGRSHVYAEDKELNYVTVIDKENKKEVRK